MKELRHFGLLYLSLALIFVSSSVYADSVILWEEEASNAETMLPPSDRPPLDKNNNFDNLPDDVKKNITEQLKARGIDASDVKIITERTIDYPQSTPEEHKKRIKEILLKKSIQPQDPIIVETTNGEYVPGLYIDMDSSPTSTMFSVKRGSAGFFSGRASWDYSLIADIYIFEEGIAKLNETVNPSLLNFAIEVGETEVVKRILDSGISSQRDKGNTEPLLRFAARTKGRSDIIKLLLSEGMDIDGDGEQRWNTPLQVALDMGALDNARTLIDMGADLSKKDKNDRTPFMQLNFVWLNSINKREKDAAWELMQYMIKEKDIDANERFKDPMYIAENSLGMNGLRLLSMDESDCFNTLDEHNVKYKRLNKTGEVKFPVLLESNVAGVNYKHTGNSRKFSVMDCRLVVALIGLRPVFEKYDIQTVNHMRVHAPGARIGGRGKVSGHHFGLAIDIARIEMADNENYEVIRDWKDRRHQVEVCKAPDDESEKQSVLRKFICDIAEQDLFHWILTPHYNKAHYDHFHIEIRDGAGYLLFQ